MSATLLSTKDSFKARQIVWPMKYSVLKGAMQVCGHHSSPTHHRCKYLPQNSYYPNLLLVPKGQESLPAEGPEPRQFIGVVDIVANSDNLLETLYLNTHHLQDTQELDHLICSLETETNRSWDFRKNTLYLRKMSVPQ